MGKSLMIQDEDDRRIETLKKDLGIHKKIEVIRAGLKLLEHESQRMKRIKRWRQAAKLVAENSAKVNKEFQVHSRMKSS